MNIKPGLYFARKGQNVPKWMWEVTGGNSDTVNDCEFKFSVNCKVLIQPTSLVTIIMPVKRHFNHILYFNGKGLDGATVSFKPDHNEIFAHGVKYQGLRDNQVKKMSIDRSYDKLSSVGIVKKLRSFKNKAKIPNINEAFSPQVSI